MSLSKILPYSFFDWCESTPLGDWLKQAMWGFAIIETIHIMALAVLLGTMVVVDLRLLGLGLKRMPAEELDRLLSPWFWTSFFTMIVSGLCLFTGEAVRLGTSGPFAYKMALVLLAVTVHLTIHRRAIARGVHGAALGKAAAYLSLICWLGIALAGRAIAFL
jgi:uncharacterized protein DUF6644